MYIKVRVQAGAKAENVERKDDTHFSIAVCEKAELNQANRRVRDIIAAELGVPAGKVRLISGHHSPSKIFSVDVGEAA